MKQPIIGFHRDAEEHWVARLACGHFQHVRHDPPWSIRQWTQTDSGRQSFVGFELNCVKCDEGAPPDQNGHSPEGEQLKSEPLENEQPDGEPLVSTRRTNLILYCRMWDETVRFYRELLRLKVHFENDWFVEFQLSTESFLSIADSRRATIDDGQGQGMTLTWQVLDLRRIQVRLADVGIKTSDIRRQWGAWSLFLYDPSGNRIELWESVKSLPQASPT